MNSILLFTNNLRIEDNKTLNACFENSDSVLPIFIFDPKNLENTDFGNSRFSRFRRKILLESLEDLEKNLNAKDLRLYKFFGEPTSILNELFEKHSIDRIFIQKEYSDYEIKFEEALKRNFSESKIFLIEDSTLLALKDLPFEIEFLPDTFSTFRNKVEKNLTIESPFSLPLKIPKLIQLDHPENSFYEKENFHFDSRTAFPFQGGEKNAIEHLQNYIWKDKQILTYKLTRNELIGEKYSTKFSPFLANGSLSARQIYFEVKKFESEVEKNESTYWVIFELLWRDFFRFCFLKHGKNFFLKNGIHSTRKIFTIDFDKFNSWKTGNTKDSFVNANMIELNQTGFMSNRGRQITASYLINDLNLDWRLGAEYFEAILIDYDVYSNWGNWAYLAGVGNDPRKDRYFNPTKQAEIYDRDKKFRKLWLD